jgi:hypothetical protein
VSKKKAVPKHCTWGRDRKGKECSLKPVAVVGYNDKNTDVLCRLHRKLVLEWVYSAHTVKSLVAR